MIQVPLYSGLVIGYTGNAFTLYSEWIVDHLSVASETFYELFY